MSERIRGVYMASKTAHAHRWRRSRDVEGRPIISTWIDEAGAGESADLADLWRRCIQESAGADVLILVREGDEILKGAFVELGAALAFQVPILATGIETFGVARHPGIRHFENADAALAEFDHARQEFCRGKRDDVTLTRPSFPLVTDHANDRRIYITSKPHHADRWRFQRDVHGVPIGCSWIDKVQSGHAHASGNWTRRVHETSTAKLLIIYREPGENLDDALVELGVALALDIPVFAVGIEEFTVGRHVGIRHFASVDDAVEEARISAEADRQCAARSPRYVGVARKGS